MLLVVGSVREDLILKHKRTKSFTVQDYRYLIDALAQVQRVVVTPNVLTEASNLLRQHRDPEKSKLVEKLRELIEGAEEKFIKSSDASTAATFGRLGLTDTTLLQLASNEIPLITTDLDLYLEALKKGETAAFNFNHLRA